MKKKMLHEYTLKQLLIEEVEEDKTDSTRTHKGIPIPDSMSEEEYLQGSGIQWDMEGSDDGEGWLGKIQDQTITVKELLGWIDDIHNIGTAQDWSDANKAAINGVLQRLGMFALDELVPVKKFSDLFTDIWKIGKEAYSGVDDASKQFQGYTIDDMPDSGVASKWKNFPVTDMFDLHPYYFSLLDDHVLKGIEEGYLEYLNDLDGDLMLKDIENIDVWAEKHIENVHLVDIDLMGVPSPKTLADVGNEENTDIT